MVAALSAGAASAAGRWEAIVEAATAAGIGVATAATDIAADTDTAADGAVSDSDLDSVILTMVAITAIHTLMAIHTLTDIHTTAGIIIRTPMRIVRIPTALSTVHLRNNSSNTGRNMVRLSSNSSIGKGLRLRPSKRRLNKTRLRNSRPKPTTTTSRTASGIISAMPLTEPR